MNAQASQTTPGAMYYQIGRMIEFEKDATDSDGARWYYDRSERVLFIYGTDPLDLRDWKHNLNGKRHVTAELPGVKMTMGGAEYADKVVAALPPHAQVRQIYGHSLGADAASRMGPKIGADLVVLIGCPRNVISSTKPHAYSSPCVVFDLTNPKDPICQVVPWNDRIPYWMGKRIRLPGKWYQAVWKPALGVTLGTLAGLFIPLVGWLGLGVLVKILLKPVVKEHHLPSYRKGLEKLSIKRMRKVG